MQEKSPIPYPSSVLSENTGTAVPEKRGIALLKAVDEYSYTCRASASSTLSSPSSQRIPPSLCLDTNLKTSLSVRLSRGIEAAHLAPEHGVISNALEISHFPRLSFSPHIRMLSSGFMAGAVAMMTAWPCISSSRGVSFRCGKNISVKADVSSGADKS